MKKLKIRDAERVAQALWGDGGPAICASLGIVQRRRKSPRYLVGMAYMNGHKAVTFGRSDVDWESAFGSFVEQHPDWKERVVAALESL